MASFDYNAPAELFLSKPPKGSRTKYRRFVTAAEALRFAVEDLRIPKAFGSLSGGDAARSFARQTSAVVATVVGVSGFYVPRIPGTLLQPPSTLEAMSFYDTTLLKTTLERLVDFDLINSKGHDVRLSLGAVNVQSGQLVYDDGGRGNGMSAE